MSTVEYTVEFTDGEVFYQGRYARMESASLRARQACEAGLSARAVPWPGGPECGLCGQPYAHAGTYASHYTSRHVTRRA